MSGLYDTDALAWSEHQAELLRLVASGERINKAIDWPNVIEEIESVGREQLRACASLLRRGIEHIIKLHAMLTPSAAPPMMKEK